MPELEVVTCIQAPPARCFYLALSVDLHAVSARQTQEQIVGGMRSGLLQLGGEVAFRARHFGIWQTLTSKITAYEAPSYFCDERQRGVFIAMRHARAVIGSVVSSSRVAGRLGRTTEQGLQPLPMSWWPAPALRRLAPPGPAWPAAQALAMPHARCNRP